MKVVSLFSGIGGIDLGCDIHFIPEFVNLLHRLVNAGHERIILQVENNPHCIQVLKTNFPATAIVLDIVTLQSLPAETDIVVAGFLVKTQLRIITEQGLKRDYALVSFHMFFVYFEARKRHGSFLKMYWGYSIGIGIKLPRNSRDCTYS